MDSIGAALKAIRTPRQPQLETAKPDPDSAAGRMLAVARASVRDDRSGVVDAEVVELAPTGIEERRWNTALRRIEEMRRCMAEAVRPELASTATAHALEEASIAARQTAVDLEQMAQAARRRPA